MKFIINKNSKTQIPEDKILDTLTDLIQNSGLDEIYINNFVEFNALRLLIKRKIINYVDVKIIVDNASYDFHDQDARYEFPEPFPLYDYILSELV